MRLILLVCLLGIRVLASDAVTKVIRTDYYEVSGTSTEALLAAMKAHRPFTNNAYTDWYIDWNYEFLSRSNECVLLAFDLRVQIRYTFPKWADSARAEKAVRKEWKRYMDATTLHEQGHADLGLAAGKEMVRLVNSRTWRAATRNELKAQVDEACEGILKEFRAREVRYDQETDHGRTQGARLRTGIAGGDRAPPNAAGGAAAEHLPARRGRAFLTSQSVRGRYTAAAWLNPENRVCASLSSRSPGC